MPQLAVGPISLLLLLPLIGAVLLLLIPRQQRQILLTLALLSSIAAFVWSLRLFQAFDAGRGDMQFVERIAWMPTFGIG
jgi:NADH-quinone oxidoreductase subunit M